MANFDFTLNTFIMARERTFNLIRVEGISAIPHTIWIVYVCATSTKLHIWPRFSAQRTHTHTHTLCLRCADSKAVLGKAVVTLPKWPPGNLKCYELYIKRANAYWHGLGFDNPNAIGHNY